MQTDIKTQKEIPITYIDEAGSEITIQPRDLLRRAPDDARYARGYELFIHKHVSKNPLTNVFKVVPSKGGEPYDVDLDGCTCRDYAQGFVCKHIHAVEIFQAADQGGF